MQYWFAWKCKKSFVFVPFLNFLLRLAVEYIILWDICIIAKAIKYILVSKIVRIVTFKKKRQDSYNFVYMLLDLENIQNWLLYGQQILS